MPRRTDVLTTHVTTIVVVAIVAAVALGATLTIPFHHFADDMWFATIVQTNHDGNVFAWLGTRYDEWTSRILIELVQVSVVNHPLLWKVGTAIAYTVLIVVPAFFFGRTAKQRPVLILLSAALVLAVPVRTVFDVGYVTTTAVYLWPLAASLIATVPVALRVTDRRMHPVTAVVAMVAMVYGANAEILSALLVLTYAVAISYQLWRRQPWKALLPYAAVALAWLLFALFSPGNAHRAVLEAATWFPGHPELSLLRKVEMGYSATLRVTFMNGNLLPAIFFGVVAGTLIARRAGLLRITVALIPFVGSAVLGFGGSNRVTEAFVAVWTDEGVLRPDEPRTWVVTLVLTALLAAATAAIILVLGRTWHATVTMLIVYGAFFSRFILAFSPTVWHAGARADTFLLIGFAVATLSVVSVVVPDAEPTVRTTEVEPNLV